MIDHLLPLLVPLLGPSWLDPQHIIEAAGAAALWVVAAIVFAECGLAVFFLPGDSLLFTVGMFCAAGVTAGSGPLIHYGDQPTTLLFVLAVLTVAAIGGNICGYWIGRAVGPALFKERTGGVLAKVFSPKNVTKTNEFFVKYGSKALILARFVPIVRTFVTMVAGVGKMSFRHFIAYTAIGGVAWVLIATLAGFFLGQIPLIRNNFEIAVILIVIISVIPMLIEYLKARGEKKKAAAVTVENDPV